MGNLLIIFKRELAAYFNSAVAYIFIIVFVLLNSGMYMTQFFIVGRADMRIFFSSLPFMLAFFLPAVAMRLWAEEKRGNTAELLLTFPMAPHQLVLGKFLASFIFYLAALACTLIIPAMLIVVGNPDVGGMVSGYLGAIFLGAFFLSIGIFISGFTKDQIVAFILAMMVCFSLHLIGTAFVATSVDGWLPGFGTFLANFIGTEQHYISFARGVMDNRDVAYFIIGSAVFLILNGFWIEGRLRPKAKSIFSIAAVTLIGIFMMANWLLSEIPLGRFDFTEGKVYTISDGSKTILKNLRAPVLAKVYISPIEKMPTGLKTLEQDVKDKLDEVKLASSGNFDYKIFHVEAANLLEGAEIAADSLEMQLGEKGIRPFQVQAVVADEVDVRLVYSSISLAYKEKPEQLIPRVMPNNLHELEYLLVSKMYRMDLAKKPKVALFAPIVEKKIDEEFAKLLGDLEGDRPDVLTEDEFELIPMALNYEGYDVERIKFNADEPIPSDTDTLFVAAPEQLNDRQRYEIEKFIHEGGSVFLAVQNYHYDYSTAENRLGVSGVKLDPQVNQMLKNWGLGVDTNILVDKQHDTISLGGTRMGPYEVNYPVKLPMHILIHQSGMNPEISITSRLSTIFYLWGTAISIVEDKLKENNLDIKTLLTSTAESWKVKFTEGPIDLTTLNPTVADEQGPFPLAVMVEGQFPATLAAKPAPNWPSVEGSGETDVEETGAELSPAPGKLLLVGAGSFLKKNLLRNGGHLNLLLNSVDSLTLGEELVTIRSKQVTDRNIGRISSKAKVTWRLIITLIIPLLIAAIGAIRLFLRKQSKRNYLKLIA